MSVRMAAACWGASGVTCRTPLPATSVILTGPDYVPALTGVRQARIPCCPLTVTRQSKQTPIPQNSPRGRSSRAASSAAPTV